MKRKELVRLLELVNPAISASGLVPVFSCFMFSKNAVTAFNGDSLAIKAKFKGDQTFAVDGKTLLGLLQNSNADEVIMTLEKQDVHVKAGKSNFKLPFFTKEEFLFEEPSEDWDATCNCGKELLRGLEICLTTTCRDNAMPALMGLCFNCAGTDLTTLYSCDGDAVTRFMTEDGYEGEGIFTVPNSFCEALLKITSEAEGVTGKIELSSNWAKATLSNGFTVYGRVIKTDNPLDHADLIKTTMTGKSAFVDLPEGLSEALARARVLADPESKSTLLTVFNGKLDLLTKATLGEAADSLPMKGHDDVEAEVHASLVQRSIGICDQISIRENCVAYQSGSQVLQVVSNVGG
jgi:DNA polymerase III sliding clamp (beta) subunit (PCNA family)